MDDQPRRRQIDYLDRPPSSGSSILSILLPSLLGLVLVLLTANLVTPILATYLPYRLNSDSRANFAVDEAFTIARVDESLIDEILGEGQQTPVASVIAPERTPEPSTQPSSSPTATPTSRPTATPTSRPTATPSNPPTAAPTQNPAPGTEISESVEDAIETVVELPDDVLEEGDDLIDDTLPGAGGMLP